MDKFQYIIRMQEWKTLKTDKAKIQWCRDIFDSMAENNMLTVGIPARTLYLRQRRALTTAFHTFDKGKLPSYIPAIVHALRRKI